MPKILMIAADYPPCLSAGVQRTYHFSENLYKAGWQPLILTAHPRIYQKLDNVIQVSEGIKPYVKRAFAADASVHLAIKGKYFGFLENPDKIASWYYHGWRLGLKMIKEHQPDVIWSTFPVSTAHRIALKLKQKTGIKWVADFRDPLHSHCDDNYKNISQKAKDIDKQTVEQADILVFATQNMAELYKKAYPMQPAEKFHVIGNGYDESLFEGLERTEPVDDVFTLLYSGGLYPHGRDPVPLFHAIAQLVEEGKLEKDKFLLKFRGAGDGAAYISLLSELNITKMVQFLPSVPYKDSIQEMKNADGLLVLQGKTFNNQIPGKIYEYIATGNPILGLVGEGGACDSLLSSFENTSCANDMDVCEIKSSLLTILCVNRTEGKNISAFSRKSLAQSLILILSVLLGE
tara:strand:+ start:2706 stop:3917 length:1212 start_codon:yes stop_codon:yes gene_type:complete